MRKLTFYDTFVVLKTTNLVSSILKFCIEMLHMQYCKIWLKSPIDVVSVVKLNINVFV